MESFEQGSEMTDDTPPAEGHQTWGGRRGKTKAQRSMGKLQKSSMWDAASLDWELGGDAEMCLDQREVLKVGLLGFAGGLTGWTAGEEGAKGG